MERLSSPQAYSLPHPGRDVPWSVPWSRLLPLWRHAVWLAALFVVLAVAVLIRLDVQRLQMDLDRNDRAYRHAQVQQERLRLERDARRRLSAAEVAARAIEAGPNVKLVDLREAR